MRKWRCRFQPIISQKKGEGRIRGEGGVRFAKCFVDVRSPSIGKAKGLTKGEKGVSVNQQREKLEKKIWPLKRQENGGRRKLSAPKGGRNSDFYSRVILNQFSGGESDPFERRRC